MHEASTRNSALATTAAWALSNMARGPNPKLQELFAIGAGDKASRILLASQGRVIRAG